MFAWKSPFVWNKFSWKYVIKYFFLTVSVDAATARWYFFRKIYKNINLSKIFDILFYELCFNNFNTNILYKFVLVKYNRKKIEVSNYKEKSQTTLQTNFPEPSFSPTPKNQKIRSPPFSIPLPLTLIFPPYKRKSVRKRLCKVVVAAVEEEELAEAEEEAPPNTRARE